MSAKDLALLLNKSKQSIYNKANKLGLSGKTRKNIDMEKVYDLYVVQKKTLKQLAEVFDTSEKYMSKIIPSEYRKSNRIKNKITPDKLKKLYCLEKKSLKEIGIIFNEDATTVHRLMKKYGIETRNSYETNIVNLNETEIINLYNEGYSCSRIAEKMGVSKDTVRKRLEENNITLKEQSFYVSGEKSNTWKGGITPENKKVRESSAYKEWRIEVFKRDSYTCQACEDGKGGNLHAHHIENFSDNEHIRFDINNGITLCNNCHSPNIEGSFHHTYGTKNNTKEQLEEFIRMKNNN